LLFRCQPRFGKNKNRRQPFCFALSASYIEFDTSCPVLRWLLALLPFIVRTSRSGQRSARRQRQRSSRTDVPIAVPTSLSSPTRCLLLHCPLLLLGLSELLGSSARFSCRRRVA